MITTTLQGIVELTWTRATRPRRLSAVARYKAHCMEHLGRQPFLTRPRQHEAAQCTAVLWMLAHCNISHPMNLRNSFAAASKSIRYAFVDDVS